MQFHGVDAPPTRARKLATIVGVKERSYQEAAGTGFKVITSNVVDLIGEAVELPSSPLSFTLNGYCQADEILEFKLGPHRGHAMVYAVVLISQVEEANGVRHMILDKVEQIDSSHSRDAIDAFKSLRRMAMGLRPDESAKRSRRHADILGNSPYETSKCKSLARVPTDAELPDLPGAGA